MKKALLVLAAIVLVVALVVWVASWFRAEDAVATSASRPWPGGMGTLESAAGRYPPLEANEAARKLTELAQALPASEAVDGYVQREIARGELTIGNPPALADVTAIRELLLREPIVWKRDPDVEIGDSETSATRAVQMTVARALVASALAKGRANDPAAWEDLRAVWSLARSLDGHPVMMTQTASLSMTRMINATAWKLPLPAPDWIAEIQKRDHVRPLIEAFQVQSASYWEDGAQIFPTRMLAASVDHDRGIAEGLLSSTTCDGNAPMNKLGTDLRSVWRRAFRYRAEREAAANALRIRAGQPIESKSACSDGTWSFDGTTLRFSREIPAAPPGAAMPLVLQVKSTRSAG